MSETDASSTTPATTEGAEAVAVPFLPDDWDRQATERIISTVDDIRAKSSGPAIGIARAMVFGLLAIVFLVIALIVLLILAIRALSIILPVWLGYLILGGIFCVIGMFAWSRRPRGAAS